MKVRYHTKIFMDIEIFKQPYLENKKITIKGKDKEAV